MAPMDSPSPATKPLFPKLAPGPGQLPRERVAKHQKARLEGAMVEAVARHGYAGTTLRELVTLAGVSKSTFYQHFESKQDCFLATFDEIVRQLSERVGAAYRSADGFHAQLTAGLTAFMSLAVEEPAAAALAAVESLTLGRAGVEPRERAAAAFEALIAQSFEHSPSATPLSPVALRAVVGGVRGVAYRALRADRREELPGSVEALAAWALAQGEPDDEPTARAVAAAAEPAPPPPAAPEGAEPQLSWTEPPDSQLGRASLTQRERIVRAAARVVVEHGYEALSIPAISGAAGVSNQTFYENFSSKREPFIAAFEILSGEALTACATAFAAAGEDRPTAIGAALRALLEHIAANELFARLAFFELPTAGPVALDRADAMLDSFVAFLDSGDAPSDLPGSLPQPILEAIPTGAWAVIQHEMATGRLRSLPAIAPELARVVLASYRVLPSGR